jgi:hypothetical protein
MPLLIGHFIKSYYHTDINLPPLIQKHKSEKVSEKLYWSARCCS